MKVKAAVFHEPGVPFAIETLDLAAPGRARCWCAWRRPASATATGT